MTRIMRIGIDARMVNHSGIGTYLKSILRSLPALGTYEYILFGSKNKLAPFGLPTVEAGFPIYSLREQVLFPYLLAKNGIDLLHVPHYTVPLCAATKIVVTVHDTIHLVFPQYVPKFGYVYAKFMISAACRKAAAVLSDSDSTKNDLLRFCGLDDSKITVVYPAVSDIFAPPKQPDGTLRQRYGRYILSVGVIRPHKNTVRLIDAYYRLKQRGNIPHKLVLVGACKAPYDREVRALIERYSLRSDVVIHENVTDNDLTAFYRAADLFVFPSLYEGFGLPPLEAMACGCPVVSSRTSSIPEVVGDAALLVDPYDVDSLVRAMAEVLGDRGLRDGLVQRGSMRVKEFTAGKTAAGIKAVYDKVLA